jgi:peptide/nickel transport system substrate-binding protein
MKYDLRKLQSTPVSRRQFLRYSIAGGAAAWLASHGLYAFGQQRGGTMVWLGHQEVAGLGPNDVGPTVQAVVIYNILNPLLHVNHLTELENVLLDSYEVAEDGLTYTFNLKQGVQFHDGSELTAEDVKYTFEYYSQPGNAIANEFLGMAGVDVPDKYTAVVNMNEINAAFLAQAGEVPIVPAAYHDRVGEEGFRTDPIGTGAFRLREWRPAEFTEIEAFGDHFRGRPGVDAIRLEVVPEPSVRYIALQTGDAHSSVWPLLVEDSLSMEGDPNFRVVRTLAESIKFFPLNNDRPQFSDRRVRQALLHALDRERIIEDLWNGAARVAHSNLSPKNAFYHNENVPRYAFDPERARSLLDEAGWVAGAGGVRAKDGTPLSFTCTTITGDQARRPIAELAQQLFRDVGVDMRLAEAPVASILEGMRNGNLECSLFNWTHGSVPEPDPSATLRSDGGDNFNRYSNPEMDRLIDEGLNTVDPDRRQQIYYRIQELFAEDVPGLYLQFDEWINVFSTDVQGLPDEILSGDPVYFRAYEQSLG